MQTLQLTENKTGAKPNYLVAALYNPKKELCFFIMVMAVSPSCQELFKAIQNLPVNEELN